MRKFRIYGLFSVCLSFILAGSLSQDSHKNPFWEHIKPFSPQLSSFANDLHISAPHYTTHIKPIKEHTSLRRNSLSNYNQKIKTDKKDYITALKSLHIALSEMGDGHTFKWRKSPHSLHGQITPTSSFRDRDGRICRHIIFSLSRGKLVKKIEAIACRTLSGNWAIDG